MIATNYTEVRENFKKYCDAATHDHESIFVTRKNNENVVIISEANYNNMLENMYIRSNDGYYQKLLNSIEELKNNKVKTVDFKTLRAMEK